MRILAIETSCDDTAISIVEVIGPRPTSLGLGGSVFRVLAHNISSQIKVHQEWGGVVPNLAKREHGKNLVPILIKSLEEANFDIQSRKTSASPKSDLVTQNTTSGFRSRNLEKKLEKILEREIELKEQFLKIIPKLKIPKIDAIAVTKGPGLEPALWVGINFAKALALVWDLPLYPVNHLEGHILASLATPQKVPFPVISLIVSGGHTELVLSKDWLKYKIIGRTRDDAVGEAFDKVARILDLPYPGGPAIAELAKHAEHTQNTAELNILKSASGPRSFGNNSAFLPRPMLHSGDFDFSFSGLKTAVLYLVQNLKKANKFNDQIKAEIAYDFQNAAVEVLVAKTLAASKKFKAQTIIAGGGVIANTSLREALTKMASDNNFKLLIPELSYSTDNATMIALAAGLRLLAGKFKKFTRRGESHTFKAEGNLNLK